MTTTAERAWLAIGLVGQGLFTARFLVQWVASEKEKDSVIPVAFWWFSLAGGATLFTYAIHKWDPVFMIGQGTGLLIYVRNLMLVGKGRERAKKLRLRAGEGAPIATSPETAVAPAPAPAGGPHLRIDAPAHAR